MTESTQDSTDSGKLACKEHENKVAAGATRRRSRKAKRGAREIEEDTEAEPVVK